MFGAECIGAVQAVDFTPRPARFLGTATSATMSGLTSGATYEWPFDWRRSWPLRATPSEGESTGRAEGWQVRAQTATGYVYADGEPTYWEFRVGSDPAATSDPTDDAGMAAGGAGMTNGSGAGAPARTAALGRAGALAMLMLLALTGGRVLQRRRPWWVRRWGLPAWVSLLALLAPAGAAGQTSGTRVEYYHLDAVGSVRVVTDGTGQVVRRHDFGAFGEEVAAVHPNPERQLFTSQERDAETALDYFGARYYRADLGRFTTVDPGHVGGDVANPQTWNAYAYAGNNPLRNIDPDGRRWFAKNGNAVWVEPNKDRSYTSPGEGWVELDPSQYPPSGMHVAYVNGQLSRIGEDAEGHKMLAPWMPPEQGLQDTSFSLLSTLWMGGTAVRAGVGAVMAARGGGALAGELSFTSTTAAHMAEAGRRVPVQILAEAIKHGTRMPDPQGAAGAVKIVEKVFVNGVPRTLEIIYRAADKTILHFVYK